MSISKLVLVEEMTIPGQDIIVNGVKYTQSQKVICIACPTCGNVMYQYPQDATRLQVLKHITSNKEDFEKVFKYCSMCGQKLSFDSFDVVEVQDE